MALRGVVFSGAGSHERFNLAQKRLWTLPTSAVPADFPGTRIANANGKKTKNDEK